MPSGRPWFQFFASDWRSDAKLRMCSLAARGLWADLMALMHDEGEPYGFLRIAGEVIGCEQASALVGRSRREVDAAWKELRDRGVSSFDEETGCMYSRRMVRDEEVRQRRAAGGKLGGNPNLANARKVERKDNHPDNHEVNRPHAGARALTLTLESEGSFTPNGTAKSGESARGGAARTDDELVAGFDLFWAAYPRAINHPDAQRAWLEIAGERPPIAEVLAAVAKLGAHPSWVQESGRFVPAPAKWLRRKGWLERVPAEARRPGFNPSVLDAPSPEPFIVDFDEATDVR